jgi:hypothetical protein
LGASGEEYFCVWKTGCKCLQDFDGCPQYHYKVAIVGINFVVYSVIRKDVAERESIVYFWMKTSFTPLKRMIGRAKEYFLFRGYVWGVGIDQYR